MQSIQSRFPRAEEDVLKLHYTAKIIGKQILESRTSSVDPLLVTTRSLFLQPHRSMSAVVPKITLKDRHWPVETVDIIF